MKKIGLMAAVVVGVLAARAGFMYECTLTVAGYRGSGIVANFPVLVRISPERISGFRFSDCRPDGYDVQFVSSDETVTYPHEIESWNLDGESCVWVRLPEISGTTTSFKMLYGDASRSTAPDGRQVWSTATGDTGGHYAGVWHLAEEIDTDHASTTVAADSAKVLGSDFVFDGVPTGGSDSISQMVSTNGVVGNGRVNSGRKGTNLLQMPAYSVLGVGGSFAFSGWFKADGVSSSEGCCNDHPKLFGRYQQDWNEAADTFSVELRSHTSLCCYGFWAHNLPDCVETWTHYAVVYDGQEYAVYANGVLNTSGTMTKDAIVDDDLPLLVGGGPRRYSLYGKYDELRLLDAVPSADWFQAEYDTVHDAAYVSASAVALRGTDVLYIMASGDAIGAVNPPYGQYSGTLQEGTLVACTASTDSVSISDSLRERVEGWKLYGYDASGAREEEPYDQAATNQVNYIHAANSIRSLEWQIVKMRPVTLEASAAANFTINGEPAVTGVNWVDEGPVAVTVLREEGTYGTDYEVSGWSGDVGGAVADGTNLAVAVSGPLTLRANFSNRIFVSADAAAGGDGTRAKPFDTISAGIAAAQPTDAVLIGGGTYAENVSATGLDRVTVRGGYDASDWSRDLIGHPTVVKPASGACFRLDASTTNVISGLVLTGGSYGFWLTRVSGNRLDQLVVTNNTSSGIYYDHDLPKANATSFAVTSSYLADNGRYGLEQRFNDWESEAIQPMYVQNCTIVSNAVGGIFSQMHRLNVVNSVVCGNAGTDVTKRMEYYMYGSTYFHSSCLGTLVWPDDNAQSTADDATRAAKGAFHFRAGVLRGDPRLNADGSLRTDSRLIARGEDLSDAEYPVTEDVLGRSWNGVYDIGAFKSTAPTVHETTYADTYVAEDGDDDAEGDAPERALKTVAEGVLRTAPGGICHVGEGVYGLSSAISTEGVTLAGAGRGKTVLKPSGTNDAVLAIAAHDVTVCDLGFGGGAVGALVECDDFASNTVFRSCLFDGNVWGVVHQSLDKSPRETELFRNVRGLWIDRSRFRGNRQAGIYLRCTHRDTYLTSSFIDGCGCLSNGVYCLESRVFMYNDTILSCTGCGFYNYAAWGASKEGHCYNVVFAENGTGWKLGNDCCVAGRNCLFDNDVDLVTTYQNPIACDPAEPGFVFEDAMLILDGRRRGRPKAESPAADGGIAVSELSASVPVADDVNGNPYCESGWAIGAFAQPKPGMVLIIR